jgi:nucleoside-diphosphate-sugar epimerase
MKILITGGTGFIGKHLANCLKKDSNNEVFIGTHSLVTGENYVIFPLDNPDVMNFELCSYKFDVIYHLAAQSSVAASFKDPFTTFDLNVIGSMNLIKVISQFHKNIKLIFPSSSDTYKIPSDIKILDELIFDEKRSEEHTSELQSRTTQ